MFVMQTIRHSGVQASAVRLKVAHRVFAKLIDLSLVTFLAAFVLYPVGPLMGFLYSLLGDGMQKGPFRGQSLGKKLMGLQVLHTLRQEPANYRDSMFRNAPVGVATFFGFIPVWGWLILGLIGVPLMVIEIYLMLRIEKGHRLGDVMADTEVIEIPRDSVD